MRETLAVSQQIKVEQESSAREARRKLNLKRRALLHERKVRKLALACFVIEWPIMLSVFTRQSAPSYISGNRRWHWLQLEGDGYPMYSRRQSTASTAVYSISVQNQSLLRAVH